MRLSRVALALLALALVLAAPVARPAPVEAERFATGLASPVDLAFGPDGRLYYAELETGNVRVLQPDGKPSEVVFHVAASPGGNGGFTGLVADPEQEGVFYVQYSMSKAGASGGKINRVSRIDGGNETVLLDNLGWAPLHVGGRVAVGADGFLYVTTGDNDQRAPSQDPRSLLGKVLRMTTDGKPAPGNPDGWHPLVYAMGFRNPFGIVATADGEIYVSDNGGNEEVNRLVKGGNYGWPACSGKCGRAEFTEPLAYWNAHFGPTGVAERNGTVYLTDYALGRVHAIDADTGKDSILWSDPQGLLLDVEVGPDDCLYVAGRESVWRIPLGSAACALADKPAPPPVGNDGTPDDGTPDDGPDLAGPDDGGEDDPDEARPAPGPALAGVALAVALALAARRRA